MILTFRGEPGSRDRGLRPLSFPKNEVLTLIGQGIYTHVYTVENPRAPTSPWCSDGVSAIATRSDVKILVSIGGPQQLDYCVAQTIARRGAVSRRDLRAHL